MNKQKLDRLIATLTADKKKLMMMLALVMVGLLLWGRLLLKPVPRSAIADPDPKITDVGDGPSNNQSRPHVDRPTVFVDLSDHAVRDIFAMDSSFYERIQSDTENTGPEKSDPGNADNTEDPDRPQLGLDELTLDALMGNVVVINGQVVKPGRKIGGWELIKIGHRHVVLQWKDEQVELKM